MTNKAQATEEDIRLFSFGKFRIVDRRPGGPVIERRAQDALGKPKWDEIPSQLGRHSDNTLEMMLVPAGLFLLMIRQLEAFEADREFPETTPAPAAAAKVNGIPAAQLPRRIISGSSR